MLIIELENVKDKLLKAFDPILMSLLNGKEVEVKPGVFMKLDGALDFTIKQYNNGLEIKFKLQPHIRVNKLLNFYGDLTGILITKDGIELRIDGLPDVFLQAVS